MKQAHVELLNYIDLGEGGQQRSRVSSSEAVTVEADFAARVVWIRCEGKPDRWVPFEQVKSGTCEVYDSLEAVKARLAELDPSGLDDPPIGYGCLACGKPCASAAGLAAHVRACSLRAKAPSAE